MGNDRAVDKSRVFEGSSEQLRELTDNRGILPNRDTGFAEEFRARQTVVADFPIRA